MCVVCVISTDTNKDNNSNADSGSSDSSGLNFNICPTIIPTSTGIENCNKYIAWDNVVNTLAAKCFPKYLNSVLNTAFGIKPATTPSAVPFKIILRKYIKFQIWP